MPPAAPGLTSMEGHPAVPGLRAQDGLVVIEGALHGTEGHRAAGTALRERQDGAPRDGEDGALRGQDRGRPCRATTLARSPGAGRAGTAAGHPCTAPPRWTYGHSVSAAGTGHGLPEQPCLHPASPTGSFPISGARMLPSHRAAAGWEATHPHEALGAGTTMSRMGATSCWSCSPEGTWQGPAPPLPSPIPSPPKSG